MKKPVTRKNNCLIQGPNSGMNVYSEHTEMGSFLPKNMSTEKEKVIINNEVLNPATHELTLGSEPYNELAIGARVMLTRNLWTEK